MDTHGAVPLVASRDAVEVAHLDLDDPAPDAPARSLRLPDVPHLRGEDTGDIPFVDLLAAEFDPDPPQDRIELSAISPAALDAAVAEVISGLAVTRGRHNRYMPVPGEDGLRTDDLAAFLQYYGHEYQITVFRAADVRTASLLDVGALTAIARAEGASVFWDWTGAVDWMPLPAAEGVAGVFWSAHRSLVDGRLVPAGHWRPGSGGPQPESLRSPVIMVGEARDRAARLAGFAAQTLSAIEGISVVHPSATETAALPVLVVEAGAGSLAIADALGGGVTGFLSVLRYGDRVVALPDGPGGSFAAVADALSALRPSTLTGGS